MSDEPSLHRVLVVARTLAGHGVCVGAMERSGAPRRLVPDYGQATWNWPRDARFRVGQEWDLWYVERPGIPPHVEDAVVSQRLLPPNPVAVHDLRKARRIIEERAVVWTGPLDGWGESAPFDGSVRIFKNLRPTVFDAKQDGSPVEFGSVGFWRPPYELMAEPSGTSVRFRFHRHQRRVPRSGGEHCVQGRLRTPEPDHSRRPRASISDTPAANLGREVVTVPFDSTLGRLSGRRSLKAAWRSRLRFRDAESGDPLLVGIPKGRPSAEL